MIYKLCPPDPVTGVPAQCIQRITDTAFIPFDPANTDYQEYIKWIDAGNTPLEADK